MAILCTALGELYVPPAAQLEDETFVVRVFSGANLQRLNKIFVALRKGAIVVLEGDRDAVTAVSAYVDKKRGELVGHTAQRVRPRRTARQLDHALLRLGVAARADGTLRTEPRDRVPYLAELLGARSSDIGERLLFVPLLALEQLQATRRERQRVDILDVELGSAPNVLVPRSQETTECFASALDASLNAGLPSRANVLDMGCGSGCLTLLAAQRLATVAPRLWATDVLPEALACSKANLAEVLADLERPLARALLEATSVMIFGPSDLYAGIPEASTTRFELVLFNAPWVDAEVRSREETTIHDPGRMTLQRFLAASSDRLTASGRILLGYADGPRRTGIDEAEAIAEAVGFRVVRVDKRRVATHRRHNKWQTNAVLTLARVGGLDPSSPP